MSLTPTLAMGILRLSVRFCMSGMAVLGVVVLVRGIGKFLKRYNPKQ
jgi:hypothetical protein